MLAILGSILLFCLIGTLVWLCIKAGGILAILGVGIIISVIITVVFLINQKE